MKTSINAEIILASKNRATGTILYTWRLTYPRIILPENLTHRVFSRNTSSTRAIPTWTMIKTVIKDMFVPSYIGAAQKGMQSGDELTGVRRKLAEIVWRATGWAAATGSYLLYKLGVAKQIAGRPLEPFSWVTQVMSATDMDNFLLLRNHDMAEPHFHELAAKVQELTRDAEYKFGMMERHKLKVLLSLDGDRKQFQILDTGEWHLPFLRASETLTDDVGKKVSTARAARTSYTLLGSGKTPDVKDDMSLCDRLFADEIKHLSPTEHPAQAMPAGRYANFQDFKQYRMEIETNEERVGIYFTATEVDHLRGWLEGFTTGLARMGTLKKLRGEAA